jgi:hypothetical protein
MKQSYFQQKLSRSVFAFVVVATLLSAVVFVRNEPHARRLSDVNCKWVGCI